MAITYKAIETITLTNNNYSNIIFGGIPQTYTDLVVVCSVRANRNATFDNLLVKLNNNYFEYWRVLQGRGTQVFTFASSGGGSDVGYLGTTNTSTSTADTFSNTSFYIANYTSSGPKPWFSDSIAENYASGAQSAYQDYVSGVSNLSAGISSIDIFTETSTALLSGSKFSLYGIKKS
jgi:hypothetical protein